MIFAILGVGAAVVVLSLLMSGAILWLGCRLFKIERGTFGRCLATAVLLAIVGIGVNLAIAQAPETTASAVVYVLMFVGPLLLLFLCIGMMLRASVGKTLLVGTFWTIGSLVCAIALAVGLRQTVMEAFHVPTGGMATTLLGYHKSVTCPECGLVFPVNASAEADPMFGLERLRVVGCDCPNCRANIDLNSAKPVVPLLGGDRILMTRFGYGQLQRRDVVVFDFPNQKEVSRGTLVAIKRLLGVADRQEEPVVYVKRLIGMPGETIGIYRGKLYAAEGLHNAAPVDPGELRKPEFMHIDEDVEQLRKDALKPADAAGKKFHILRKTPEQVLTMRRLVHDNDHQAKDLIGKPFQRWQGESPDSVWKPFERWKESPDSVWKPDSPESPRSFRCEAGADAVSWLRYRHLLRTAPLNEQGEPRPELITDFLGYNTGKTDLGRMTQPNWVGDLILEGKVKVEKPAGELQLELRRGPDRFQARFQLDSGTCTLVRQTAKGDQPLGSQPTRLKQPGEYLLRFANVDDRLTVWVDSDLPFSDGVAYDPAGEWGPAATDLQPAGIGARNATMSVSALKLWRDTYYTVDPRGPDAALADDAWCNPAKWEPLQAIKPRTFHVHPGHYFGLGDNSPASSDSREWGLIPERLIQGRALLVYYPFQRAGLIR